MAEEICPQQIVMDNGQLTMAEAKPVLESICHQNGNFYSDRRGIGALKDLQQTFPKVKQDDLKKLPSQIRKLYEDFAVLKNGRYGCPGNFNRLTMSWYLNESKDPNVCCDDSYNFKTLKDITAGEELTVDYSSYP